MLGPQLFSEWRGRNFAKVPLVLPGNDNLFCSPVDSTRTGKEAYNVKMLRMLKGRPLVSNTWQILAQWPADVWRPGCCTIKPCQASTPSVRDGKVAAVSLEPDEGRDFHWGTLPKHSEAIGDFRALPNRKVVVARLQYQLSITRGPSDIYLHRRENFIASS